MKRYILTALAMTACTALGACETLAPASAAAYGPAPSPKGSGFSEQKVEADRFRVSYRGPSNAPAGQLNDYALLRAADLTLAIGYDWFRVVNRTDDLAQPNGPRISLGTGSSSYGRRSSVGVGVSTGFNLGGPATRLVTLEIKLNKGKPPTDRDAYDARDVAKSIRARL
ncbi:hypothetical protein BH11PSE2_BH11PSE2_07970 [soil metagenome]